MRIKKNHTSPVSNSVWFKRRWIKAKIKVREEYIQERLRILKDLNNAVDARIRELESDHDAADGE